MTRAARAAALLLGTAIALAGRATAQPPAADWLTIETPHFRVHYPAPFGAWAERAAASLESIHAGVTAFVGYSPPQRIDVVVADPVADSNGAAFPFLDRPVVVLWAYPPDIESGIGDSTDWIDLVSVHEVAHVAHLLRPRNRAGFLWRLLPLPVGPLLLSSPRWLIEGYATLVEGALTGSGRPNSSLRAMVLRRFAAEGRLPSYGALSATSGWLGGSMAYLVGSSFLEWLEAREGAGSLQDLWKRMASRRGGDFATCFQAIFGRPPSELYDRYRAEMAALAIADEKRRERAGLQEGELWQRLSGATFSPQISPDGRLLLAFRSPRRRRGFLGVWTLRETEEERRREERRRGAERRLLEDPNEVADKPELPRPREPRWRLPRWNGQTPEDPRFLADGRVLFSRRVPDAEAVLHRDLFVWDLEGRRVSRVTRLADVFDADPEPGGAWAIAVRNRHGVSDLVRVDLATGATRPLETGPAPGDAWRVWSHPRVSPDGRTVAALLHENGEWKLVAVPSEGGAPRELACCAVGPPAWTPDGARLFFGSDASGVWEIASVEAAGRDTPAPATRVTGGAFSPAPTPDGKALFFLSLTARGVDLRRLELPVEARAALPREAGDFPILPPTSLEPRKFAETQIAAPHPYRALSTQVLRVASGFTAGPSGNSYQAGVEGSDVIGRLDWLALGAFGNAAGPRGGSLAAAWSGLPAKLTLQLFSALEKPGSQRLVRQPELDEQREGFFADASWGRPFDGGRVSARLGGGWSRVEALQAAETFSRTVGTAGVRGEVRRTRAGSGFSAGVSLDGAVGNTAGGFWSQYSARASVSGITRLASLGLSAGYGDTGGAPTDFDLFWIGGADSSIFPPGLDRNRLSRPALPSAVQRGGRVETYGAELRFGFLPLVLYAERLTAWTSGAPKPDPVELAGAELRLDRLVPRELLPQSFSLYLGVARIRSTEPFMSSTQGYGGLIYRP